MAIIEGFKIKNYGPLKEITLGKLWNKKTAPLTPITVVIRKNGAGKSTLFDAFGFLSDCLMIGVEEACDLRNRGGYKRLCSQGSSEPIEFEIYYKENRERPITYKISIVLDDSERPFVRKERLRQRRKGQDSRGRPFSFLRLEDGKGIIWKDEHAATQDNDKDGIQTLIQKYKETDETEKVELSDKRNLGIAALGSLKQHPRISAFRRFIEGWYLSYFTPDAARNLPLSGPQKHLNFHGDNLSNVVQFMEREHPERFNEILNNITSKIPGINRIETENSPDGRFLMKFNDRGFKAPFYVQKMSDGTLKVFSYLLLMHNPVPPPFLGIEEPENGLYHKLLETLIQEFRAYTVEKNRSQIFMTTHQPYLVDALSPDEAWRLKKGEDGFSVIQRASDDLVIINLVAEGLSLGSLWYSEYLDKE